MGGGELKLHEYSQDIYIIIISQNNISSVLENNIKYNISSQIFFNHSFTSFLFCRSLDILDLQHIFGFVVNKPSNVNIIGVEVPVKRPHWFAVRKINESYYNLDSKLSSPECVGNEERLFTFLTELLSLPAVQLLVIVKKSVAENNLWKKQ